MTPLEALAPEQEERLARYRAGAMDERERAEFEREILASDALSEALYAEGTLDAARVGGAARETTPRAAGVRRWAPFAAAAAVLVVAGLLAVRPRPLDPDSDRVRDAAPAPPAATAAEGTLAWGRVAGAGLYRVTLVDSTGAVITATLVRDTTVRLADLEAAGRIPSGFFVTPVTEDGVELPALPLVPIRPR